MKTKPCDNNVHLHCSNDSGGMGDAITCHDCGYSKYPEVFKGKYMITDTIANYKPELQAEAAVNELKNYRREK